MTGLVTSEQRGLHHRRGREPDRQWRPERDRRQLPAGTGTITGNVSYTSPSSSTFGGVIAGAGNTLTLNNALATLTLTNASTYTGATTVTACILQVTANTAMGQPAAGVGAAVASGGELLLNNVGYATPESLTINGTGVGGAGALSNTGTSSYAGQVTAATNSTINDGGGSLTFTGGLVKNGTTLTLTNTRGRRLDHHQHGGHQRCQRGFRPGRE